jgi:hypothetical protein
MMSELRERALAANADDLGVVRAPGIPWAVLMETGYPGAVASLVTFVDGSASLYLSTGGGVIGGGQHANVNKAARALVAKASAEARQFSPALDHSMPSAGVTRFYVRTDARLLTAEAPENELGEGKHPLSSLFYAGQDVITQLREISENKH